LDGVVYLPPTTAAGEVERMAAATGLAERGTPVVVQLSPGQECPTDERLTPVYDLLPSLWHGDLESLHGVPSGAAAVWPLIRGVTDGDRLVTEGIELLGRGGVEAVVGLPLDLSPGDRREVVRSHGDEVFDLVFHGGGASARRFARSAHRAGLRWWLERPLAPAAGGGFDNRRLAAVLLALGSLWLRLGEPPVQGHAFYRAGRWIDTSRYDVAALLREGNLEVVAAVDGASRDILHQTVEAGRCTLMEELRARYVDATDTAGEDG